MGNRKLTTIDEANLKSRLWLFGSTFNSGKEKIEPGSNGYRNWTIEYMETPDEYTFYCNKKRNNCKIN